VSGGAGGAGDYDDGVAGTLGEGGAGTSSDSRGGGDGGGGIYGGGGGAGSNIGDVADPSLSCSDGDGYVEATYVLGDDIDEPDDDPVDDGIRGRPTSTG